MTDSARLPLHRFIRERRESLGLTQRAVAERLGFKSVAHLSDIESGNRKPGRQHMRKLAEVLRVSPEELLSHDARAAVREVSELLSSRPELVGIFRKFVSAAHSLSAEDLESRIEGNGGNLSDAAVPAPMPTKSGARAKARSDGSEDLFLGIGS